LFVVVAAVAAAAVAVAAVVMLILQKYIELCTRRFTSPAAAVDLLFIFDLFNICLTFACAFCYCLFSLATNFNAISLALFI